jgi:hypothetical protein
MATPQASLPSRGSQAPMGRPKAVRYRQWPLGKSRMITRDANGARALWVRRARPGELTRISGDSSSSRRPQGRADRGCEPQAEPCDVCGGAGPAPAPRAQDVESVANAAVAAPAATAALALAAADRGPAKSWPDPAGRIAGRPRPASHAVSPRGGHLVMFWSNHFGVSAAEGAVRGLAAYEREAIRPHVLGRFSNMLLIAAERHPGDADRPRPPAVGGSTVAPLATPDYGSCGAKWRFRPRARVRVWRLTDSFPSTTPCQRCVPSMHAAGDDRVCSAHALPRPLALRRAGRPGKQLVGVTKSKEGRLNRALALPPSAGPASPRGLALGPVVDHRAADRPLCANRSGVRQGLCRRRGNLACRRRGRRPGGATKRPSLARFSAWRSSRSAT